MKTHSGKINKATDEYQVVVSNKCKAINEYQVMVILLH